MPIPASWGPLASIQSPTSVSRYRSTACFLPSTAQPPPRSVSAAGSIVVISALCGRPYGLFLQWCRKLFRVPPEPKSGRPEAGEKDVPSP
ncbi:L-alanine exporter AlaE [Mesorhizobium amorphae]